MSSKMKLVCSLLLAMGGAVVGSSWAEPTKVPQTRTADAALADTKEVEAMARTAAACKWDDSDETTAVASYASILIGLSTKSFEECRQFNDTFKSYHTDEMLGSVPIPRVDRAACKIAAKKNRWNEFKKAYTIEAVQSAFENVMYSENVCAYQPLQANQLSVEEAQTDLMLGVLFCNAQVIDKAISLGADVNKPFNTQSETLRYLNGTYALQKSLESTTASVCQNATVALIKKGANAKQIFYGKTTLTLAITTPSLPVIAALIDAGADPKVGVAGQPKKIQLSEYQADDPTDTAKTPLMEFVQYRAYKIEDGDDEETSKILALLIQKSDLNSRDWLGRTALMLAAEQSQTKVAQMLLAAGADKTVKDNFGRTAAVYANIAKNQPLEKILSAK